MGGNGSGKIFRWDAKSTTESQKRIDIRWLKKYGYLRAGNVGSLSWSRGDEQTGSIAYKMEEDRMILNYRHRPNGGEWEPVEQKISLDRTPCNYGGYRKWFRCPRCYKRVAILYGAGKYFLCRHCYNLTYDSCNTHPIQRIFDKANKLRKKLGGETGAFNFIPDRPKGMHRSTYDKIVDKIWRLEHLGDQAMFNRWGVVF